MGVEGLSFHREREEKHRERVFLIEKKGGGRTPSGSFSCSSLSSFPFFPAASAAAAAVAAASIWKVLKWCDEN